MAQVVILASAQHQQSTHQLGTLPEKRTSGPMTLLHHGAQVRLGFLQRLWPAAGSVGGHSTRWGPTPATGPVVVCVWRVQLHVSLYSTILELQV